MWNQVGSVEGCKKKTGKGWEVHLGREGFLNPKVGFRRHALNTGTEIPVWYIVGVDISLPLIKH